MVCHPLTFIDKVLLGYSYVHFPVFGLWLLTDDSRGRCVIPGKGHARMGPFLVDGPGWQAEIG